MANQPLPDNHHLSPFAAPSESSHELHDNYKTSYDDLIDEYGSEYSPNSRHQAVALGSQISPAQDPFNRRPFAQQSPYGSSVALESPGTGASAKNVNWGYPPSPPAKQDAQSFWSKWLPDSVACRLFVLVVVVETIIDLAIEGKLLLRFHEVSDDSGQAVANEKMAIYLSVFAFAHVFQLIMALDAVYARNTLQFLFLTMFNAVLLLYAVIQIKEIQNNLDSSVTGISSIPVNALTTIIPVVVSVAEVCFIGLGWKIYTEFGWKVYKFIGADRQMKKMYANYQVYHCLLKFDFFFWAGFSIQFIGLILQKTDWEYYVTCAALPLSILLLIEGYLAARYENKWMMATFMVGCVGAMVYFVYKLYRVLEDKNGDYDILKNSLSTFSVIAILFLVATFVFACLVMGSFGCGLKEQLAKSAKLGHSRWGSQHASKSPGMSAHPHRMSID